MLQNCYTSKSNSIPLITGFKMLICSCINQDYKLIMNDSLNHQIILTEIVKKISIHIIHIEDISYTLYKYRNIAPIVYIYSNNSHYGLIYHLSIKYLDEKTDSFGIDFRSFPFLYNPSKKFSLKIGAVTNSTNTNFLDIISILVQNLKPLDSASKSDLLMHVNSLKTLCPDIQGKVQELYDKAISQCGHQGREYTPVCLQSHCMDCLMDAILDSKGDNTLCPCGIPLDESDLKFLTSDTLELSNEYLTEQNSSLSPVRINEEKILTKKNSIKRRRPSASSVLQKLPAITNNIPCSMCRKQLNKDSFAGVKCQGHSICLQCRFKRFRRGGEQCPICNRFYNNEEISAIKVLNNSIDLASSFLNTGSFIDNS